MIPLLSLAIVLPASIVSVGATDPGDPPATRTTTTTDPCAQGCVPKPVYDREHAKRLRLVRYSVRMERERNRLKQQWRPTVQYALTLASRVTGVSYAQMARVSYCESTWNPYAQNGRYKGLFQLGWSPFGMSPYDPVANALSAALTVRHDGSWRQWSCRP